MTHLKNLAVLLVVFTLSAVAADAQITLTTAVNMTFSLQNPTTDNGTITSTLAYGRKLFTTKDFLKEIALAENAAGNYGSTTFPAGAKLVAVVPDLATLPAFRVVDKNGVLLVNVSNFFGCGVAVTSFGYIINSQRINDANGVGSQSNSQCIQFVYDDTPARGANGIQFSLTGTLVKTAIDGPVSRVTNQARETITMTLRSGTGDGSLSTQRFMSTGTLSMTGTRQVP